MGFLPSDGRIWFVFSVNVDFRAGLSPTDYLAIADSGMGIFAADGGFGDRRVIAEFDRGSGEAASGVLGGDSSPRAARPTRSTWSLF